MKILIVTAFILVIISPFVGLWGVFKKCNEKPWKAIIPIYNIIILLSILKKPKWYVVFIIVPLVSNMLFYNVLVGIYKRFGKTSFLWHFMGIILAFIILPMLGFSKKFKLGSNSTVTAKTELKDWGYSFLMALALMLFIDLLNVFMFQNYRIPTSAMEKTLLVGDHIFVSKWSVGPRIPMTPLSLPSVLAKEVKMFGDKHYISSVQLPYMRLSKKLNVERNEILVFNFPEGDTVVSDMSEQSYYNIIRNIAGQYKMMDERSGIELKTDKEYYMLGRQQIWNEHRIIANPVDCRDNYIKRCVAIPGDTFRIIAGQVFINGRLQEPLESAQFEYKIKIKENGINPEVFEKFGIKQQDIMSIEDGYLLPLTKEKANIFTTFSNVKSVELVLNIDPALDLFPHSTNYPWKLDDYGPLWIPKKGATVNLTVDNLCLYERIINAYEGNKLEVKDNKIYINDKPATTYTFQMDYYFMMGDNRHKSSDCRFWGFVPEDHIVGSPKFIWLSLDPTKSFPANIRWKRMFTSATR